MVVVAAVLAGSLAAGASSAVAASPAPACSGGAASGGGNAPLYTTQTAPQDPFVPTELVPDQWLAKLFTEGLGCAPDQSSYAAYDDLVRAEGCSPSTLAGIGISFLTSPAFLHRPYNYGERLLVLWRIARESEPDPQTFAAQYTALSTHRTSWADLVGSFFDTAGFGPSVPRLCSGQLYGWNPNRSVIAIPTSSHHGAFAGGTGAQLQQLLDRAAPGGTVWLDPGAVVRVGDQLKLPPGVTLETVGAPKPAAYAAMARLVRTSANGQPVVAVSSGAKLKSVWVDGQRSKQGVGMNHDSIDVAVLGGSGTTVQDDRIDNTSGWSNMVIYPTPDGSASHNVTIVENLVDGYSTKFHWYETAGVIDGRVETGTITGQLSNLEAGQQSVSSTFGFADGISNAGEDSYIAHNQIVDATDVSIVVFRSMASGDPDQHSVVEDNTIVNAGNSGWSAFTVDPLYPPSHLDFSGTTITNNLLWTSPNAFLLLGAGIGTRPWFGDNTAYGDGVVRFTGNTTGKGEINTQMAIAVSRMSGAIVQGNMLRSNLEWADLCPHGSYIGVDDSAGSRVQSPNTAVDFGSYPIPSADEGCLSLHF
jgi:hypothetical protein